MLGPGSILQNNPGAIAVYEFSAFERADWGGLPAGFSLSWSDNSQQAHEATEAIKSPNLQAMAIEIGHRHKVTICCCLPPAFSPGAVESTAAEMNSGAYVSAVVKATKLSAVVVTEAMREAGSGASTHACLVLLPPQVPPPPPPPPGAPPGAAP